MPFQRGNRWGTKRLRPAETLFGMALDDVLAARGVSANEAEGRCGIAVGAISMLRHGSRGATFTVLAALESGLALSDDEVRRLVVAGLGDARRRADGRRMR